MRKGKTERNRIATAEVAIAVLARGNVGINLSEGSVLRVETL